MFDKYIAMGKRRMLIKKLIWAQMLGLTGASLPWQTFVGNPLQFNAPKAHTLKSATVEFAPKQDLHGYSNPWPAGGGKNKLQTTLTTQTIGSVTITVNADGTISLSGTTPEAAIEVTVGSVALESGDYNFNGSPFSTNMLRLMVKEGSESGTSVGGLQYNNIVKTFTAQTNTYYVKLYIGPNTNTSGVVVKPMLWSGSVSDATFAPYSNICPISGRTGVDIYNEPDYDPTATPKLTVTWQDEAGTVYGGTYNFTTGVLTADKIYNKKKLSAATVKYGETNPFVAYRFDNFFSANDGVYGSSSGYTGRTICNLAPYAFDSGQFLHFYVNNTGTGQLWAYLQNGIDETIDIEVVATLLTPITYQLDPQTITALKGINTMWTDGDSLTVEARGEAVNLSALQSLNMLLGGRYYNNGTEDEPTDEEALSILMGGNR